VGRARPSSLPNALYRGSSDVWSTPDSHGRLIVVYTDNSTGVPQVWTSDARHTESIAGFTPAFRVDPTHQTQFFPWLSAAPTSGQVDLIFYDRSCDPLADTLNCVSESSTADGGATWSTVPVTKAGFDGDKFGACLALSTRRTGRPSSSATTSPSPPTDPKAQMLWTANGPRALDVFSDRVTFT